MIRVAICDDSGQIADQLQRLIVKYPNEEPFDIKIYFSGRDLLRNVNEENKFDIVFMDIRLGDNELGHEVGIKLKDIYPHTLIIYISSYSGYSDDVNNAEPLMFLEKPLTQERVYSALGRAIKRINTSSRKYYYYTFGGVQTRVDLNEVLYIESYYKLVRMKMKNKKFIKISGKTLEEVYKEVEEIHPVFFHPKKSVYVNAIYVDSMTRKFMNVSGEKILFSRNYEDESMKDYFRIIKSMN